jgi:hypothetical protein
MDSIAGLFQEFLLPHERPNIPPSVSKQTSANISQPSIKFATEVCDI